MAEEKVGDDQEIVFRLLEFLLFTALLYICFIRCSVWTYSVVTRVVYLSVCFTFTVWIRKGTAKRGKGKHDQRS
jgi:hypothetical protein